MGRDAAAFASVSPLGGGFQLPLVLVVMAVQAQQFPVAPIGRIVVVVMIPVMDRQLAQVGPCEFAAAATADPRIDLERLLPVSLFALCGGTARFGHHAVQLAWVFHDISVRAGRLRRRTDMEQNEIAPNERSPSFLTR